MGPFPDPARASTYVAMWPRTGRWLAAASSLWVRPTAPSLLKPFRMLSQYSHAIQIQQQTDNAYLQLQIFVVDHGSPLLCRLGKHSLTVSQRTALWFVPL
jgi:hypothetical protein